MTFKRYGLEFFQEELDALAAEVGKLANEIEFAFREEVQNGIVGRVRHIVNPDAPAAPASPAAGAPAADAPTATVPPVNELPTT
jgi:hypothetical protein